MSYSCFLLIFLGSVFFLGADAGAVVGFFLGSFFGAGLSVTCLINDRSTFFGTSTQSSGVTASSTPYACNGKSEIASASVARRAHLIEQLPAFRVEQQLYV